MMSKGSEKNFFQIHQRENKTVKFGTAPSGTYISLPFPPYREAIT